MGYLPLGQMENQCRDGLEQVARRVGLDFIINVVLDAENRVVDLVTGDFVQAHRAGAQSAKKAFGVPLPCQADILISCSYPYDIDYWQCEKALITRDTSPSRRVASSSSPPLASRVSPTTMMIFSPGSG